LTSPGTEVTNLIFPNDAAVYVSWKHSKHNIAAGKNVNVAVAAHLKTQARMKLYDYMSVLGKSVLYCDTKSVFFIHNVDDPPRVRTGNYLGHLSDEMEEFASGSFIQEFVSCDPKNYAFSA